MAAAGEWRGDVEDEVSVLTLSRNGSLDARERFFRAEDATGETLGSARSTDNRGWEVAREWIGVGIANVVDVDVDGGVWEEETSSNPKT